MYLTSVRWMYAFNDWANARVLRAASQLPDTLYFATSDHSLGSIHDTLFHMFNAEVVWRTILQHNPKVWPDVRPDVAPTLSALRSEWSQEQSQRAAYLDTLTDADLASVCAYALEGEPPRARVRWHVFWHVFNHATQHRAEVAHMLKRHGTPPGPLDVMWFAPPDGTACIPPNADHL